MRLSSSHQSVVLRVIDQPQDDHISVSDCIEQSVERWKVQAVQIGHTEESDKLLRDCSWGNHLAPLPVYFDLGDCGLEALPDSLCGLSAVPSLLGQSIKDFLGLRDGPRPKSA